MENFKEGIDTVSRMADNEVTSVCILVVKEDHTCNNIIKQMLHLCKHQVLRSGSILNVLHAIWEKTDMLDLVLTNADKLGSSGAEVIEHIQETLHLPVMSISLDKREFDSRGQPVSFEAFVLNGLSLNDFNKLWRTALERERGKMASSQEENVLVEKNKTPSLMNDFAQSNRKHKGIDLSEGHTDEHPTIKKQRVTWTPEKHKKFEAAVAMLGGYEIAVPKKIVEVMNDPELTRENVASHLQKFRLTKKRAQGNTSLSDTNTRNEFQGLSVLSSSFETKFERRDYTSLGGLLFSDQSGLEELNQDVPKFCFTPNFGIYEDQKRNMLLSIDNNISSNMGTFVGIRVTSDGKLVGYGNTEASVDMIKAECSVSTPFQGHSVSDIHVNNSVTRANATSSYEYPGLVSLSSCGLKIDDHEYPSNVDPSAPPSITSKLRDSGNEEDVEKCFPLCDQDWGTPATDVPFQYSSELSDILVTPSTFPLNQEFSIPPLVTPGNDFPVQATMEFLDAITELPYPQDYPLLQGTGLTSHQFDLEEFDALLGQDD